ncbi:MAG: low molecular weight protein-tyrosine-phosphatase [Schleiferiaceae bacterium]|nr:low molecular weight protein-tyrosine-phosphatase [Schleiferiaceae bacterium]
MVCLGNICRSPLAEGLLRSKVDPQKVSVDSAGTAGYHVEEAPDVRMIKTARRHGIDLAMLRGRQFGPEDFDRFDQIYVMDQDNYEEVMAQARHQEDREKVKLLLEELPGGGGMAVPDPYFGGDEGFENVYKLLDEATTEIAKKYGDG